MEKRKIKIDTKSILLILMAVALVFSFTIGSTLAWFASRDGATGDITLGMAVRISVTDEDGARGNDIITLADGTRGLPGSRVPADIWVTLDETTTATVMRARFNVTIDNPTILAGATEIPLGWTYDGDMEFFNPANPTNEFIHSGAHPNFEGTLVELYEWIINAEFFGALVTSMNVAHGWVFNAADNFFYFLGSVAVGTYNRVMTATAETNNAQNTPMFGVTNAVYENINAPRTLAGTPADTVLASVIAGEDNLTIPFLVNENFRLPTTWENVFAQLELSVEFEVQAIQDFILAGTTNVLPTIGNVAPLLNARF